MGETPASPPVAARRPRRTSVHGIVLSDDYGWLKDPAYPEVADRDVLAYLEAENAWFQRWMAPRATLKARLLAELKSRIQEEEASVPWRDGAWDYRWRFVKGAQYRRWERAPAGTQDWRVVLDEARRARGRDFYNMRALTVSPDGRYAAFSEDRDGSERYVIRIRDLETGRLLGDELAMTWGQMVWAGDSRTLLYTELNDQLRPWRARAHRLGDRPGTDRLLYEEADGGYFVHVGRTQSREFLTVTSAGLTTSETRLLPADDPHAAPRLVAARREGHLYSVDHANGQLVILTNDRHKNYRVATADPADPGERRWKQVVAGSDDHYLRGIVAFKGFLAIQYRDKGLDKVRIRPWDGRGFDIHFPEEAYTAELGANPEYDVARLRISYESMVTPPTVFDYDLADRRLVTRKVRHVPGYDPARFETHRLTAKARDGVDVPVTVVMARGFRKDGTAPLHLYAYGAYGHGITPYFSPNRISLLERGFAFAIAHIRGGDELGAAWHDAGKLNQRWNTFNDFVDVGRFLAAEKCTSAGRITASGGSAGGELMGVVANTAPELWGAICAHVPFVDVLRTMLDADLPLTPLEWPEWGNPVTERASFAYIRSYSPYDNVARQAYPPMMVTAGLNDPRVTYWEPAKWVARLRRLKTDQNALILKTNMGAGHQGKSGRYASLEDVAEDYTFILSAVGVNE